MSVCYVCFRNVVRKTDEMRAVTFFLPLPVRRLEWPRFMHKDNINIIKIT